MADLPDSFSPFKQLCQCGHDVTSHFDKKHNCLGMYCDCKMYLKPGEKAPAPAPKPQPVYEPVGSDHDDGDSGPITPRTLPWSWPP